MVKRMIVVFSAMALIITAAGVASAQFGTNGNPVVAGLYPPAAMGDMVTIPMRVIYTFDKRTGSTPGGDSTLMLPFGGCPQYLGGFRPWGVFRGTTCVMRVEVKPPKCVVPGMGGPVEWGAPPMLPAGAKLVSNMERFQVTSPGCNPCATGGMKYSMVKKQAVTSSAPVQTIQQCGPAACGPIR